MKGSVHSVSPADLCLRLRKIEGQVRGLQRMIDDRSQCAEILVQIASTRAALNAVGLGVLDGELSRSTTPDGRQLSDADACRFIEAVELLVRH
jgi:DNA-binding FrmR family transcriptional regulator